MSVSTPWREAASSRASVYGDASSALHAQSFAVYTPALSTRMRLRLRVNPAHALTEYEFSPSPLLPMVTIFGVSSLFSALNNVPAWQVSTMSMMLLYRL
jgi:hypothetical protein